MHLRRALLLFAIVLGLAALVTSISRTPTERNRNQSEQAQPPAAPPPAETTPAETAPTATPVENDPTERAILFDVSAENPAKRVLELGRNATVFVETDQDGQVDIEGLGLTESAQPGTPAVFEVLENETGSYEVRFSPSTGEESRRVGVLEIVAG